MTRLLAVELTRFRSRRAIALLALATLVVVAVLVAMAAYQTRPLTQEDRANARSQLVLGVIAATAPFLLGSLADRHGLAAALALEPVLIGICLLVLWAGLRANRRIG